MISAFEGLKTTTQAHSTGKQVTRQESNMQPPVTFHTTPPLNQQRMTSHFSQIVFQRFTPPAK